MDQDSILRISVEYCWGLIQKGYEYDDSIRNTVDFIHNKIPNGKSIAEEKLVEHLRLFVTLEVSDYRMLHGEGYENKHLWWSEYKSNSHLEHWNRWRRYLTINKQWAPAVLDSIDETTDKILDAIDDPKEQVAASERRGLVLGYVQSGKTAHYTGLINKALDAGFQLVIVLAGMHDSLRMQTQVRLDEEVFGYDSSFEKSKIEGMFLQPIGVGEINRPEQLMINMYTSRDRKGDFNKSRANKIQPLGGRPSVFVVKKNATVLKNLYQFLRTGNLTKHHMQHQGKAVIANISMLMIDDEADHASVNTNSITDEQGNLLPDYEPSRINGHIRMIYNLFSNKAYIGYTATPYANIFIHDEARTEDFGSEMFPKDFLMSLPKPSNYIGPAEFFGIDRDDGASMDLIRPINYEPCFVPAKAKKGHIPRCLPDSLINAIGAFLISSSVRLERGHHDKHMSMLIHAARFTGIQTEIKRLIADKINEIKNRLRYERPCDPLSYASVLEDLWTNDFTETSNYMRTSFSSLSGICEIPQWPVILKGIGHVLDKLEILEVNGISDDDLRYKDYPQGRIVIAVGGDKLSRGLTLEGLSISYFLRASTFYDTLMQMGRWFGYRPDYLDLCRLYTTPTLAQWFGHIALATEELRSEIVDMEQMKATPKEYGLKVRTHSELLIAARNKMQAAYEVSEDYSNKVSETTKFDLNDEDFFRNNQMATDLFIRKLGTPNPDFLIQMQPSKYKNRNNIPKHYFWDHVEGNLICSFLSDYQTASNAPKANSRRMRDYIIKQMNNGGLVDWTVCLINTDKKGENRSALSLGGISVESGVVRKYGGRPENRKAKAFGRLLSGEHEYLDLDDEQMALVKSLESLVYRHSSIRGKRIKDEAGISHEATTFIRRKVRGSNPEHGFMLIYPIDKKGSLFEELSADILPVGIGVVFPPSHLSTPVTYMANNVFRAIEEEDEQE